MLYDIGKMMVAGVLQKLCSLSFCQVQVVVLVFEVGVGFLLVMLELHK